jgi:uncharacterized protein
MNATRPRVFRDPIHGQIAFSKVNLDASFGDISSDVHNKSDKQIGWLLPKLINTLAFQRLRHVRQNGLCNIVFHGMEHSRFSHSVGVSFLAREMYDHIIRNSATSLDEKTRIGVSTAGLLHDIGHGPFSHTIEEILKSIGHKDFHHEILTESVINNETSEIFQILSQVDRDFPSYVTAFINKNLRSQRNEGDCWYHRIISSQLDADRLDYLLRDIRHAGLIGRGLDLPRLFDMIYHYENRIVVDRHAIESVENYLLLLKHAYEAIYFHRANRGISIVLMSCLKRASYLFKYQDDADIFSGNINHPFKHLIMDGVKIDINHYCRLSEFHMWALIENWQFHPDIILADLSRRLISRKRFKSFDFSPSKVISKITEIQNRITELIHNTKPYISKKDAESYYFFIDETHRTPYKFYNFEATGPAQDESIWLFSPKNSKMTAIENEVDNQIFQALRYAFEFHRIYVPGELFSDCEKIINEYAI